MVTLTTVNWMHEADFLCAKLASCGIEASIPDQSTMTVLPLYGSALGGIRIQVEESDLEKAREFMRDMIDEAKTQELRCPKCDSATVDYERVSWRFAAVIVLLIGIPLLWLKKKFTCRSCGHRWRETESADQ